jgi:hypothetical protein
MSSLSFELDMPTSICYEKTFIDKNKLELKTMKIINSMQKNVFLYVTH